MAMFKRKVLYLGGFDPRGARFYHQLCAAQMGRFGSGDGGGNDAVTTSARRRVDGDVQWDVRAADGSFVTRHVFLAWDDIVRRLWVKGRLPLLKSTLIAYWNFSRLIDWRAARAAPRGSKITLFYPGASMLLLPVVVALLLWPLLALLLPTIVAAVGALAIAVAINPAIMQRLHSKWLLRFIIFNDLIARDCVADVLDARTRHFADRIDAVLAEDWDEILFVTHSNGSILAVPVMVDLLARHGGALPDRFSLVTLGCTIQLVALRRDAHRFHGLLDRLAAGRFRWLDIGSLTDGACIPLVDPCITRPVPRPANLVQLSPRWFRYCEPAAYRARRRNKYETHFDYLRRLDHPSPLDYVGMTCGTRHLPDAIAAFRSDNAITTRQG